MKKYKLFQFTSKNTGYYFHETDSLIRAKDLATKWPHIRIDGPDGFFQEYKEGKLTSWSMRTPKVEPKTNRSAYAAIGNNHDR